MRLNLAASTQNQALCAIIFMYRYELDRDLGHLEPLAYAGKPRRLPLVLTPLEVATVLEHICAPFLLSARLLYGAGLRLGECVRLRVQDLDFGQGQLVVRRGKGQVDRVTLLPRSLVAPLRAQIDFVAEQLVRDTAAACCRGTGRVVIIPGWRYCMSQLEPVHVPGWIPPPPDEELVFDDGVPMESSRHRDQMVILVDTLKRYVAERGSVYVAGNQAFHFSPLHVRNRDFRAPDVLVVAGVDPHERKGWVTWHEDSKLPTVIIELLSDSTREEDEGPKKRTYEWLGIRSYAMFDPFSADLVVYHLTDTQGYVLAQPDSEGRYDIPTLGLRLGTAPGVHDGSDLLWLRWFTPDGAVLPTGEEAAATERARADGERARADGERVRADEELARRKDAEGRLAEALARLAALEGRAPD